MKRRYFTKARLRVTKLDMARQIVAALYDLPELPDMETASRVIKRRVKQLKRRPLTELRPDWEVANKILQTRP